MQYQQQPGWSKFTLSFTECGCHAQLKRSLLTISAVRVLDLRQHIQQGSIETRLGS